MLKLEVGVEYLTHLLRIYLRQDLSMNLGLTNLAKMVGQEGPVSTQGFICLHLPFMWVLGIDLRPSCLYGKHFTN